MKKKTLTFYNKLYYSFRLGGWSKIMLPTLFGQLIGMKVLGDLAMGPMLWGFALGALCTISILFLNDLADEEVDQLKREYLPKDSSPKTLPDELMSKNLVLALALGSSMLFIGLGFYLEYAYEREKFGLLCFWAIFINWAYSFWPIKLNYRGGGELAEAFGVGMVMPYLNAYLQSASSWHPLYFLFIALFFWALAQALTSGVCDITTDKIGGKKTFSVFFGNRSCVLMVFFSLFLCSLLLPLLPGFFFHEKAVTLALIFLSILIFYGGAFKRFYQLDSIETEIIEQKYFRKMSHRVSLFFSLSFLLYFYFI